MNRIIRFKLILICTTWMSGRLTEAIQDYINPDGYYEVDQTDESLTFTTIATSEETTKYIVTDGDRDLEQSSMQDGSGIPTPIPCKYNYQCYKQRCCSYHDGSRQCCGNKPDPTTSCVGQFGRHTGVRCPPYYARERKFCCNHGRNCCLIERNEDEAKEEEIRNGGMGVVATTAIVFLAVIIAGILLTMATRYIKVKIRRERQQAGNQSQQYIDAVNNRHSDEPAMNIQPCNDNNDTSSQPTRNVTEEDDDEPIEPPSYAEAMSCPVVLEDQPLRTCSDNRNFTPPRRPKQYPGNGRVIAMPRKMSNSNQNTNFVSANVDVSIIVPKDGTPNPSLQ